MKVATWHGADRFTVDDAPEPVAGAGQVVVDVHAAGICGTDIHATQGLFPGRPPLVMGHEYSGIVREVGRGVSRRLIGGRGLRALLRVRQMRGLRQRPHLPVSARHARGRLRRARRAAARAPILCPAGRPRHRRARRARGLLPVRAGDVPDAAERHRPVHRRRHHGSHHHGPAARESARRKRLISSDPLEERRAIARKLGAHVVDRSRPRDPRRAHGPS
mgnify:CR=1 FL=1